MLTGAQRQAAREIIAAHEAGDFNAGYHLGRIRDDGERIAFVLGDRVYIPYRTDIYEGRLVRLDAPADAPPPAIDPAAVDRAAERCEAVSMSPRCYDWRVRPESRADDAEIRALYDRYTWGTGFEEAGIRARREVFARIIREELGPGPDRSAPAGKLSDRGDPA